MTQYVLLIGVHGTRTDALADLRTLVNGSDDAVAGSGVLNRAPDRVTLEQPRGGTLAYMVGTGAAFGVAGGAFFGMPLIAGVAGATMGGLIGWSKRREEVSQLMLALHDLVPVGASALVAVVAADRADWVGQQMGRALRVQARPLDSGPLRALARTLVRGNPEATDALGSIG